MKKIKINKKTSSVTEMNEDNLTVTNTFMIKIIAVIKDRWQHLFFCILSFFK